MVRINAIVLVCGLCGICQSAVATQDWRLVGQSTFRFVFWDIYHARLFTPSGHFEEGSRSIRLSLRYLRSIGGEELRQATKEQWQAMGLWNNQSRTWLSQIKFPDVEAGDDITFILYTDQTAQFIFNGEVLFDLVKSDVNRQFLSIWLSSDGSYPKFTKQLKGQ